MFLIQQADRTNRIRSLMYKVDWAYKFIITDQYNALITKTVIRKGI